jgi:hypothetical protein
MGHAHGAHRHGYISSAAQKEVDVGNPQFFAIFSEPIFGEVAEWLKAALC